MVAYFAVVSYVCMFRPIREVSPFAIIGRPSRRWSSLFATWRVGNRYIVENPYNTLPIEITLHYLLLNNVHNPLTTTAIHHSLWRRLPPFKLCQLSIMQPIVEFLSHYKA